MTVNQANILHEKAKTRKDGVYSYHNNYWVVKDRRFVAFADPTGECYMRMGAFNASIGKVATYERKDKLKEWLKNQKVLDNL